MPTPSDALPGATASAAVAALTSPAEPRRRRAPGMSVEQRRAMIVAAALPLVTEHGTAVTTNQIARAAGIGEATVFRAFKDKDELLDACVLEVVSPAHVLRELASIPLDEPLPDRLVQAAEAMHAHLDRMGAVLGTLHASGRRRGRSPGERPAQGSREASTQALRDGIAELLEPDAAVLRTSPEKLAVIFLGMLFMRQRDEHDAAGQGVADLVDILLHGAVTTAPASPGSGPAEPGGAA